MKARDPGSRALRVQPKGDVVFALSDVGSGSNGRSCRVSRYVSVQLSGMPSITRRLAIAPCYTLNVTAVAARESDLNPKR